MKVLLSIIISTLGALGNLTFILLIVIYIFAVLGMQLFGKDYTTENFYPDPIPRLEIKKNYWNLISQLEFQIFQMEFYRFLPFLHDDLQNIVRGVDRTTVGLYESSDKICKIAVELLCQWWLVNVILQGNPGSCLAIFIPALVVGNFMVLNLFLALLLNNFNSDELKQRKEVRTNKQQHFTVELNVNVVISRV